MATDSYRQGLDKLEAHIFGEVRDALLKIGLDVEHEGSSRAPIDTGHLRSGIKREADVKIAKVKGKKYQVIEIVAPAEYAAIQHENTSFIHPRGGEAKFFTTPIEKKQPLYKKIIGAAMRQGLKRAKEQT